VVCRRSLYARDRDDNNDDDVAAADDDDNTQDNVYGSVITMKSLREVTWFN